MAKRNERVLTIEHPNTTGIVDFLSEHVSVEVTIENGEVCVVAKCMHGEEASSWDLHEASWPLPKTCKKCGDDVSEAGTLCAECEGDHEEA